MKWFDFKDPIFLTFTIIVGLLMVFLTFMIISIFVSSHRDYRYVERMKAESTTLRIYAIDVKNNAVTYFNRSDLRDKRKIDLNTFYSHFHINDIDKIKAWIFSICTDYKKADKYLEADVLVNQGKYTFFSLLNLLNN